jgi:hypothetical protein
MKYCISKISFFDNELQSKIVDVDSEVIALILAVDWLSNGEMAGYDFSMDDKLVLKHLANDMDGAVNAILVSTDP